MPKRIAKYDQPNPYAFKSYDPVIDRLMMLLEASRIPVARLAETSGVSDGTIYHLRRLYEGRGNRYDLQSRNIKFAIVARLTYGLGISVQQLIEAQQKPRLLKHLRAELDVPNRPARKTAAA